MKDRNQIELEENVLDPLSSEPHSKIINNNNLNHNENSIIKIRSESRTLKSKIIKHIKKRIFILNWITTYNMKYAVNDLIAGVTLGLTIIPESIACALLAGLPTHYGLCSAFVGPLIYLFFGTINKVLIGPTSLVALVTVQFTMDLPIQFAFVLTLLAGIVELLMGVLQLGFIFDFISVPVIKAFSTATAILVIESQIKVIMGIKYLVPGFVNSIQTLTFKLNEIRYGDVIMGVGSIVFLILLKQLDRINFSTQKRSGKVLKIICNYISLSRNALLVLITGLIAFALITKTQNDDLPFRLSESVHSGLPEFKFPSLYIEANNRTYNFFEICSELGAGIFVIPLVSVLTNISIAKALTPKGVVNAGQELMVLGLCNIIGSGVQSMPTCGAFSRAAISAASGIQTSMAGLYSGLLVIFALTWLTSYFHYIPESTLAAILMCAIVTLIDFKLPIRLWNESKRDFFTWILCFVICIFFGVEVGLFFGIILNASYLLFLWARPNITVKIQQIDDISYIRVTPCNGLYFPGIDYLREKTIKACLAADFQIPVVIDCKYLTGLDYTAAQGVTKLAIDLDNNENSQSLIVYQMNSRFQNLIDVSHNLIFCETDEKLKEILTQEALRNGVISLKDHVRASIDLGYKVEE